MLRKFLIVAGAVILIMLAIAGTLAFYDAAGSQGATMQREAL